MKTKIQTVSTDSSHLHLGDDAGIGILFLENTQVNSQSVAAAAI